MKNKIQELYALEQLASGSTCIHRLHPLAKLLSSVIFIITIVSFNRYALVQLVPYIFFPLLVMALSETPYAMLFKRFLIALPFCFFAGISTVIFDRAVLFTVGSVTVSGGVVSLVTILFRTWLCVTAVLILVSVTPFSELTREMRRLRIPDVFIVMFELTYRYIGVLLNEAFSMNIAYSLRNSGKKGIAMRDMGSFAGQLLIRSFDRADRVYNAMKCRGYAFHGMPQNSKSLVGKDVVFLLIVFLFCITFRIIDINTLYAGLAGSLS